ncbi:Aste57867_11814 [Aphanomyces stellatus]|uniref:Aste57867_11814 protein n=1 Tax=Aphanomyces stellatus TaxID=120398 RepID=A0A485KUG1_9STRA|nr:hypothetical protein As57867_011769 [Aphanomyces stellatus]VFT88669.1 Aste57867_11814 [Aphanomyces stellatus]
MSERETWDAAQPTTHTTNPTTREEQESTWAAQQTEMKQRMVRDYAVDLDAVRFIGGVDISFYPNTDDACATLVVLSFPELKVVCEASCHTTLTLPYIPTFLAFREIPALLPLFDMVPTEFQPQMLLVDGNGELHPRGFGIASHLGVVKQVPTIGVAKTFLNVDGLTKKSVRALVEASKAATRTDGNTKTTVALELRGESSKLWGMALCTEGVQNPIYVSIGNLLSLPQAVDMVERCSLHRVPEPIRQADLRSRAIIREWEKSGINARFRSCEVYRHHVPT